MLAVRNHFGWRNKTGTEGTTLSPESTSRSPSAATERDAPLTTRQASRSTPRFYNVELEHRGLAMFVGGTAESEHQIAEIVERRWPEWRIVAVREES